MQIQISSGNGPMECELAVGNFLEALKAEIPDLTIIKEVKTSYAGGYKSVIVSTNQDVSHLQGTIKWIQKSPFRPSCKRKNWFIDVSLFDERLLAHSTKKSASAELLEEELVRFQTFRCGGNGGQNVNKVETGVRAIHVPTGLSVKCTEARTQHLNKKIALIRLCEIISRQEMEKEALRKQTMWMQHELLERGNPVRTYVGMDFRQKENK